MFSVRGSTARANTCRIWMTIHSSYHQENLSIIIEGWSCQIQTSSKSPPSWYIWPAVCRAPATRLSAPPRGCSHSERQSLKTTSLHWAALQLGSHNHHYHHLLLPTVVHALNMAFITMVMLLIQRHSLWKSDVPWGWLKQDIFCPAIILKVSLSNKLSSKWSSSQWEAKLIIFPPPEMQS